MTKLSEMKLNELINYLRDSNNNDKIQSLIKDKEYIITFSSIYYYFFIKKY